MSTAATHPDLCTGGRIYNGPVNRADLEALWHQEKLPLTVASALSFGEACGLVLQLPTVSGHRDGYVVGYGLMPPNGQRPCLRIATATRDRFGEPVGKGKVGVLGCMWREAQRPERVALRLWFRAELQHGFRPSTQLPTHWGAWRIVDCFDDLIGGLVQQRRQGPVQTRTHSAKTGLLPSAVPGWQIGRLDDATPEETT